MSRGHAHRAAAVAALGLTVSGCASHSETRGRLEQGCYLNDLPLASFIEEVNRCSARPIAIANPVAGNPRLSGALCICTSANVALALQRLGIQTVEEDPISLAQAGQRERRASQQDSAK